jgi:glucosylceramidase
MKTGRVSLFGICFASFAAACSSGGDSGNPGTAGSAAGTTGTAGQQGSGHGGTTGAAGQTGSGQGGSTGVAGSGHGGTTGAAGNQSSTGEGGSSGPAGASGTGKGGTTGTAGGAGGGTATGKGGTTGTAGGSGGSSTTGTGGSAPAALTLITSASGAYWKTGTPTETTSGSATVTINDSSTQQNWDGWGGAFNENGWNVLTSSAMQTDAMNLLFGTDGAHFGWGRIPMGASDYAMSRYTLDDTGTDVTANSSGSNRPPADTSLAMFSLTRDGQKLIPYIKAAQAVNKDLKFWASPWTPPVWMKTGYKTDAAGSGTAKKPSYFDGGNIDTTKLSANLTAYAQYYVKFVQGYAAQGINIDTVSPQNEPGYDQNYPSCLWDKTSYVSWIKDYLGPAMKNINVKVMLGTLSNAGDFNRNDLDISTAVLADSTAKGFLSVVGVQWGVLGKVNGGQTFSGLPIWATEHRCGNYPWNPSMGCGEDSDPCPSYNMTQAPNDQAYGVESWKYIRNAINKGKVTAYNAWNMVLDKQGLGNDTSRDWRQDALVIAGGGSCAGNTTSSGLCATPAYYVFRHMSQFVAASGAKVVSTSGGDAVGFKNPDGSVVAAMYNSGAANANYVVSIKGKKYMFSMPSNGWATLVVP